jgi:hypothetical protein
MNLVGYCAMFVVGITNVPSGATFCDDLVCTKRFYGGRYRIEPGAMMIFDCKSEIPKAYELWAKASWSPVGSE